MLYRIAIYVRVSTEEQAQIIEGSIESQQHRLRGFVESKNMQEKNWGKIIEVYIDDGFSAKDTRRPAYQRMLRDVRSGKINLILVTDLSRLSRNISDFCGLLEELDSHKAKFLSVKEQFDTSTPVGEMMIYNMINLAQFERKQTSERVSMNFHSRALRGLLNGGNPILGYDKDPNNSGKLIVNEQEVPAARQVFAIYLETGSLQETARRLNDTSIRPKIAQGRRYRHAREGRWTVGSVRSHLTNYFYIGKREVNKRWKHEEQSTLKPWRRYQIAEASWPGIVNETTFATVQTMIEENRVRERDRVLSGNRKFYLLSGVIRCGDCGRALIGQTSYGRSSPHRYYGHKMVAGEKNTCRIKRLRAEEVETAVLNHLSEILLRAGHLDAVEENIRKASGAKGADLYAERDRVQGELTKLDMDIDAALKLGEQIGTPEVLSLIQEKMEKLAAQKKRLVSHREVLLQQIAETNNIKEVRSSIEDNARQFKQGWRKASPAIKKRMVRRVIDRLIYTPDGLHTYYVTAEKGPSYYPPTQTKMASESSSGAIPSNPYFPNNHNRHPARLTVDGIASVVGSGAPGRSRTSDHMIRSHVLYPAELPVPRKEVLLWTDAAKKSSPYSAQNSKT